MTYYTGTFDDDKLVGDWRDDVFDIGQGGNDTVLAGGGDDLIAQGASAVILDHIVGGAGFDTALLGFAYADVTTAFDGANLSGVERILFDTGSAASFATFRVTIGDGVATSDLKGGALEIVNGTYGGGALIVDCSAETDTSLHFRGGEGTEVFTGGAMADSFDFSQTTGQSSGYGGGGDDTFDFSEANFTQNSAAVGGEGEDTVRIHGDQSFLDIVLRAQNLSGVETLWVESAKRIVFADGNVATGDSMTVDAFSATQGMTLDASRETRASYHLIGGSGGDKLSGGGGKDVLDGGAGKDILTGGGKADLFVITQLGDGNSTTISDLSSQDRIDLHQIDADITHDGDQRFKLVDAFTGKAGQAVISYDGSKGVTTLSFDVDGDGSADGSLLMTGDHTDFTRFVL